MSIPTALEHSQGVVAAGTAPVRPPTVPVRRILDDAEAIAVVTELAADFRTGAIERDRDRLLPHEPIRKLREAGFFGLCVPKKYGGPEVSAGTVSEIFRILSAADPSIGQIPQNHFCWAPVFETGTEEQASFFYGRLLEGDQIGNSHAEFTRKKPRDYVTKVEPVKGGYVVTGKKYYSTGASFAQWIPTFGSDTEGRSIQLYSRSDAPGISIVNDWTGMGQRGTASGTTVFDHVFVPDEQVFPFYRTESSVLHWSPIALLIHGSVDLGIAEEAYADTKDYILNKARTWTENPFDEHRREPFIIQSFGALTVELHAAQLLQRTAAESIDRLRAEPTRERLTEARFAVADARIATGNVAVHIADQLFALTGARATLEEYGLDRHWRNARIHTLHDPFRWKLFHIGNYHLNGELPGPGSYL
jgi:SfnB family sulfur acquisition oxidoreductase